MADPATQPAPAATATTTSAAPAPATVPGATAPPAPAATGDAGTGEKSEKSLLEKITPKILQHHKKLHASLERAVEQSAGPDVNKSAVGQSHHWLADIFDEETLDKLFAKEHVGNYVQLRGKDEKEWEAMPLYVRLGMAILFKDGLRFLHTNRIRELLREQTFKQGKIYDSTDPQIVQPHIESFIATYNINTSELANPDIKSYKTINEFFSRKLKPRARPIASADDPTVVTSAADCRLTVWQSVDTAKQFWIKDKAFTVASLLGSQDLAKKFGPKPSLAIFRLAPADYHRFHSPVSCQFGDITNMPGEYYTVNPQAVNENLNVFTGNRRDVTLLSAQLSPAAAKADPVPVAFVAIGALLVGSIQWTAKAGETVKKGDNTGFFQYGGSTCIVVFPTDSVTWDEDLVRTSTTGLETLVRVGEHIGRAATKTPAP